MVFVVSSDDDEEGDEREVIIQINSIKLEVTEVDVTAQLAKNDWNYVGGSGEDCGDVGYYETPDGVHVDESEARRFAMSSFRAETGPERMRRWEEQKQQWLTASRET